jgi:hypothetical protein
MLRGDPGKQKCGRSRIHNHIRDLLHFRSAIRSARIFPGSTTVWLRRGENGGQLLYATSFLSTAPFPSEIFQRFGHHLGCDGRVSG